MSHNPPKNMYKDKQGVARFLVDATAPEAGGGKRWYQVEIVRKALNKDGDTLDKDRQSTEVFATEDTCVGLAFKRCPSKLVIKDAFKFETNVFSQLMPTDSLFAGHSTEAQQFVEAVEAITIVVN